MSSTTNQMKYVRLGNSGLKVSRLILGCMSYGLKSWQGWVIEEKEAIEQIKEAYRLGINTFDTANFYSLGESERILGKAIKEIGAPRSSFVILTKVGLPTPPDGASKELLDTLGASDYHNHKGLSRKHIFESIKASLERLQLDYVDVFQCHRFDPETPIEETMQALHDVVKAGYARYIGMSSCAAWQFHMMQSHYAITNKLTPFISMQNYHSLLYRQEEDEMLPTCKLFGVGTIPWSPLSRGLLTRPRKDKDSTIRSKTDPYTPGLQSNEDPNLLIIDRVEELAKKRGVTMAEISLAWLIYTKDPVAAPIVGTTNIKHLGDMIKALDLTLEPSEIKYLEELYTPKAQVGY
ncbi:related to aryl-alcohol dehydrogenases [Serendipita indica DSM 11827]|uniref:Related to aryl-alcohol dehydrogenases n=1 Tax=Serendipita indica (strain DSM 11827) TaxID=1109443 RepID=G4TPQ8_SERID|nr:related to aryl-alcohol dehydrogenases [Serendipita indica DSM 11827]